MTLWEEWVDAYRRIGNFVYKTTNRIKFRLYGVKFGKGLCVHGHVGLKIKERGQLAIADNFYYSSGRHINPLARNIQGNITINEGIVGKSEETISNYK